MNLKALGQYYDDDGKEFYLYAAIGRHPTERRTQALRVIGMGKTRRLARAAASERFAHVERRLRSFPA